MNNSAEDKRPRLLGRIASSLWVMVIAIVIGFFYFASSLCVTFLLAEFLAIFVDPMVIRIEGLRLPRPFAAGLVLTLGMLFVGSMIYVFYGNGGSIGRAAIARGRTTYGVREISGGLQSLINPHLEFAGGNAAPFTALGYYQGRYCGPRYSLPARSFPCKSKMINSFDFPSS